MIFVVRACPPRRHRPTGRRLCGSRLAHLGRGAHDLHMALTEEGNQTTPPLTVESRYREMCSDIRFTDDISLKLLGLIPLVSGAGILAVLFAGAGRSRMDAAILGGFVGVFGAIVTFAIYRWEVRNSKFCSYLNSQVANLESDLRIPSEQSHRLGRPDPPRVWFGPWHPKIGKTEAERILYVAVILSWLALPGVAALVA